MPRHGRRRVRARFDGHGHPEAVAANSEAGHNRGAGHPARPLQLPRRRDPTVRGPATAAADRAHRYMKVKSVASIAAPFMNVMTSCEAPPL
jgi:hypothetical protein